LIVETKNLIKDYHAVPSKIRAVNKVNLRIEKGTFVSIFGSSGAGKTTLLNLIGLIDKPTLGKVFLNECDTTVLSENERRKIRLTNIGFVFQTFNLLPQLTVVENVELPMALMGLPQKEQRKRALMLLETVGLKKRNNHLPKQLSVGEMQRVAIARALANAPSLIIADEPTGELDSKTGMEIIRLLSSLNREKNITVIIATHDKRIAEIADVIYQMKDGSIKICQ
jgi:putative ABC transport system ATP-binding protein